MTPMRIAAFSQGPVGGNPAGVVLSDQLGEATAMQALAKDIGYSETAFAAPAGEAWRVRYFAPETEVPFCGHATIALGAALGRAFGPARYELLLNDAEISVETDLTDGVWEATLSSPPAHAQPLEAAFLEELMALFDLVPEDLDHRLRPMLGTTGPRHPILALGDRARLAAMSYEFEAGRALMARHDVTTIALIHIEGPRTIIARNPFAIGGVVEDPATGAAAAALAAVLVEQQWDGLNAGGRFLIRQGEDMGVPCRLVVDVTGQPGAPVRVSGTTRSLD